MPPGQRYAHGPNYDETSFEMCALMTALITGALLSLSPDTAAVREAVGARWCADGVGDICEVTLGGRVSGHRLFTADYDDGCGKEASLVFTDRALLAVAKDDAPCPDMRLSDANGEDAAFNITRSVTTLSLAADAEGMAQISFTVIVCMSVEEACYTLAHVYYEYAETPAGDIVLRSGRPVSDDIEALLLRYTPYLYNPQTDQYDGKCDRAALGALIRTWLPRRYAVPIVLTPAQPD